MQEVPNSRRIVHGERQHDALKAVAGMLKSLSYTEMKTLAEKIRGQSPRLNDPDLPEMLLGAANDILKS